MSEDDIFFERAAGRPRMRARWLVLAILALAIVGALTARAAGWTPVAPPGQPAMPFVRAESDDPTTSQTLSEATFQLAGADFHAEVRGYERLTSNALHGFELRILRTAGGDARLDIDLRGNGDVSPAGRPSLEDGVWIVRFEVPGHYDNASLAAEADLTSYRAAALAGYMRDGEFRLTLPFTYEAARDPPPPR